MQTYDDMNLSEKWERAAALRQQDFDDLQREFAGLDVGRIARFLPDDVRNPERSEKAKAERHAEMLTRLQMLMRDPAYAALYNDTTRQLREAQNNLDEMREQAQWILDEENKAIARMDARAAKDSDGRAVFKDQQGEALYADGASVPADEAATIVWRGDEPGFEERHARGERRAQAESILADIDAGQAEIGDMQERMEDKHDPVKANEMDGFQERSREIGKGISERLRELTQDAAPQAIVTPSTSLENVAVPKLS